MFDDCIEAASSHAYWKSRMDKSPPDASLRNISIPKFSLHKNVVLYNNRFNITIIRSYPIRYSMTQDLRQSRTLGSEIRVLFSRLDGKETTRIEKLPHGVSRTLVLNPATLFIRGIVLYSY